MGDSLTDADMKAPWAAEMKENAASLVARPVAATKGPAAPAGTLVVLKALADPVRYRLLNAMAGGDVLAVVDMAQRLKAHPDTIGKHVKVLRGAGLLCRVQSDGADGRVTEYQIPAEYRAVSGVLDFGVCAVRVG